MGTSFSEIFDAFMQLVNDYKLVALYQNSRVNFETYLSGWLISAVNLDFLNCNQSLSYDTTMKAFTETLTQQNLLILARIMVKYWLMREVQDVTQMSIHIQDNDFKTFSEAQNLQAKKSYLAQVQEDVSQLLVNYGLNNIDWTSWYAGSFYTP